MTFGQGFAKRLQNLRDTFEQNHQQLQVLQKHQSCVAFGIVSWNLLFGFCTLSPTQMSTWKLDRNTYITAMAISNSFILFVLFLPFSLPVSMLKLSASCFETHTDSTGSIRRAGGTAEDRSRAPPEGVAGTEQANGAERRRCGGL